MKAIFVENGELHIDVPMLLQRFGLPETEENKELVIEQAKRAAVDAGLLIPNAQIEENHKHRCSDL